MSRQVARRGNQRQAQNMVAYQEKGPNRGSRGVSSRSCYLDEDTGNVIYKTTLANERYKENKKSSHGRQTYCETTSCYDPLESSIYRENHLVSRQAKLTNYGGNPKKSFKTIDEVRTQYISPSDSWTSSRSTSTVSNGQRIKVVKQSSFQDGPSRSIDYGNSSRKAITSGKGGNSKGSRAVARYGGNTNWDYEQEQRNVDGYLDSMFNSLSLGR